MIEEIKGIIGTEEYVNSAGKKFTVYLVEGSRENETLPYVLAIPEDLQEGKELLVETLNLEGTDMLERRVQRVKEDLPNLLEIYDTAPIMIPFLDDVREGVPYYQQLSRECFVESTDDFYRIDYPREDHLLANTIKNGQGLAEKVSSKKLDERNMFRRIFFFWCSCSESGVDIFFNWRSKSK